MFSKILIANRGAIACRIIRTLDEMGIASVAVYAEADAYSLHVERATQSVSLGSGRAADTYLDVDKILDAAQKTGAEAIHPGYGFLSENAAFAERCEATGIAFIGPTADAIRAFGEKHTARAIADKSGVPLAPGSPLLTDYSQAEAAALEIGFPIMLKSTAGGGGIGMARCDDLRDLRESFETVSRLASSNFSNPGLFVERLVEGARHVEVQIFGDGTGQVVSLGERDCSLQRRHQKVIEETPAPHLTPELRSAMARAAERLAASVSYRSAGTVEFLFDVERQAFYFLEVNTRLQVEHGVTEMVSGIDLVRWMVELAAGGAPHLAECPAAPSGWSMQARLYAESPVRDFAPSSGLITDFSFPADVRCDHWLTRGIEVSTLFDPMLAKIVVHGATREQARERLERALEETQIYGVDTNRDFLLSILRWQRFSEGDVHTALLETFDFEAPVIEVIRPGIESTVQDWPGREGYWHVGVPPSGPMDSVAHRTANRLLDNREDAAALEFAVGGPTLRFHCSTRLAIAGADMGAELDGEPVENWSAFDVAAGSVLTLGAVKGRGQRASLAVQGGFDVPAYLGSRSTFMLGGFGGHGGRKLRAGDVLRLHSQAAPRTEATARRTLPFEERPKYSDADDVWQIDVTYGPHGAPEFFDSDWIGTFFETDWEVHYNSSRTGIRLIGPKPDWSRDDGGEAGLHPSNIHDNAYAIGTIDFTGDMPVILGLDGPSLGGFVCPATVVQADLWKLGQLSAGARVRFRPVALACARRRQRDWATTLQRGAALEPSRSPNDVEAPRDGNPIVLRQMLEDGVEMLVRRSGDRDLLVELGDLVLDLALRLRIHALMLALEERPMDGVSELTPGIRSLQIHYDSLQVDEDEVLGWLSNTARSLAPFSELEVPTRVVHLPLAWDHSQTRLAIEKYMQSVRPDAPWCPDNIEFIRRINGLDTVEQVREMVFEARYLVMGLGDVYLGAPVATPIDPRHRLVTTKYNPARTWTPENAVGIGGAYLCVYGMEGPGGYQFVGRTLQMWNRFRSTDVFETDRPWLLRFFDQLAFYPVSEEELEDMRREFPRGGVPLQIEEDTLNASSFQGLLEGHADEIARVRANRADAFEAERKRWAATGVAEVLSEELDVSPADGIEVPDGAVAVEAGLAANVWRIEVEEGAWVEAGAPLVVLESMKTEIIIPAPEGGTVCRVLCSTGQLVHPETPLIAIVPA